MYIVIHAIHLNERLLRYSHSHERNDYSGIVIYVIHNVLYIEYGTCTEGDSRIVDGMVAQEGRGEVFVALAGTPTMPMLCADSLDFLKQVS